MTRFQRALRFWWQRRTRGWSDDELWDLDTRFAAWLLPRLKAFAAGPARDAHPGCLPSVEEWQGVLGEMVEGFELMAAGAHILAHPPGGQRAKVDRALDLFRQYAHGLWS